VSRKFVDILSYKQLSIVFGRDPQVARRHAIWRSSGTVRVLPARRKGEYGLAMLSPSLPLDDSHCGSAAECSFSLASRKPRAGPIKGTDGCVVLSVFSNNLTHGFHCAFALESAALHYRRTMELVEHYRAAPRLRYLPLRYEDIVDEQETSTRRMLEPDRIPL
jgi:hypothetical protein